MLKNKTYFKKSIGRRSGLRAEEGRGHQQEQGQGVLQCLVDGREDRRRERRPHLDLTTHNHASCPSNTPPQTYIDEATAGLPPGRCDKEKEAIDEACNKKKEPPCPGKLSTPKKRDRAYADAATKDAKSSSCAQAVKCFLCPYQSGGENSCCDGQTGHHIPPWSTTTSVSGMASGVTKGSALCVCLEGTNHSIGSHGRHHHGGSITFSRRWRRGPKPVFTAATARRRTSVQGAAKDHIKAAAAVTEAQTDCSKECIEEQLNKQHQEDDLKKEATHNAPTTGGRVTTRWSPGDAANLDRPQRATEKAPIAGAWVDEATGMKVSAVLTGTVFSKIKKYGMFSIRASRQQGETDFRALLRTTAGTATRFRARGGRPSAWPRPSIQRPRVGYVLLSPASSEGHLWEIAGRASASEEETKIPGDSRQGSTKLATIGNPVWACGMGRSRFDASRAEPGPTECAGPTHWKRA